MLNLFGSLPNQVPTNADLGSMAYQDAESVRIVNLKVDGKLAVTDSLVVANDFKVTPIANAVNHLIAQGAVTGSGPLLKSFGSDSNIDLNFLAKGTGKIVLGSNVSMTGNLDLTGTINGVNLSASAIAVTSQKITDALGYTPVAPTGNITGTATNVTGTVAPANGGTGVTSLVALKSALSINNVENKNSSTIRGELTSANVVNALGFSPIGSISDSDIVDALGYTPIGGINSADVISALGFTPISGITGLNVTNALGFTPVREVTSANVISALGFTPISGITSANVTGALGFTPISGITSANVISALGYTPISVNYVSPYSAVSTDLNVPALTSGISLDRYQIVTTANKPAGPGGMVVSVAMDVNNIFQISVPQSGGTLNVRTKNGASFGTWTSLLSSTSVVAIANGGTGAITSAEALSNLGALPSTNPAATGNLTVTQSISASNSDEGIVVLGGDTNGAVKIGKQNRQAAGTPFIEFHSSTSGSTFDVRLAVSGGSAAQGQGTLDIQAAVLTRSGQTIWDATTLTKLSQLSNDTNFITTSSNITGTSANVTGTVALANGGTGATTAVNALNSLSAYGLQSSSVASGVDLNTLVTTGFYFQTSNVNTSFATNYPELSAGILQVYAQPNFTYQYYHVYNSTIVYVRSKYSAGAWTSWDKKITSGNIGTYAPSLSGTGATGVWGIGISGNAATATKLATAVTINGTSFDGSTSISVSDSNKLPLSGGTLGGSLTLDSAATLRLKANSGGVVGDITFFNFDGSERHRIWDGTTGLNYRNAGGTTYTLIHSGNIGSYSSSSANPSFTGTTTVARLFAQSYVEKKSTITAATASATITLDTANYNNFQLNLNATPVTLNFGTPGSGTDTYGFTLKVINGAAGQSLVFPPNGTVLKWPNGQMPTRTTTNGAIDWWYFWTDDNGVTWNASLNSQDSK